MWGISRLAEELLASHKKTLLDGASRSVGALTGWMDGRSAG